MMERDLSKFTQLMNYLESLKQSGIRYVPLKNKIDISYLTGSKDRSESFAKPVKEERKVDRPAAQGKRRGMDSKQGRARSIDLKGDKDITIRKDIEFYEPMESSLFSMDDDRDDYKSFQDLQGAVQRCTKCPLANGRTNVVFGEGNENADLMFIGEGPGNHEDLQGRPFVGRAGKLLDKMIAAMGFSRKEVYIGNIIKCRAPENRDPLPDEVAACLPYLKAQIAFIKPKVMVLLGAVALRALVQKNVGISKIRGQFLDYHGVPLMPTFHPAYLLRYPAKKKETWEDLQKIMAYLKKE